MGQRGRPSVYTDEAAEEICRRLAEGESLSSICRDEHMPPRTTVIQWVVDDREGFADRYARARDIGLDVMAESLLDIADDGRNDYLDGEYQTEHVQRSRLRVDTRKWYLSKLAPKRYGDRITTEHTGSIAISSPLAGLSPAEIAAELDDDEDDDE